MNLTRLIASALCMIGLTASIMVYINKSGIINIINKSGIINMSYLIFFELIGILLLYKGLESSQSLKTTEQQNG